MWVRALTRNTSNIRTQNTHRTQAVLAHVRHVDKLNAGADCYLQVCVTPVPLCRAMALQMLGRTVCAF